MFGKKLAELRAQQGISQYELAKRLKFSRGQIANYEQETREPDFATLILIADYFHVTLDELLGRTIASNPAEPALIHESSAPYLIGQQQSIALTQEEAEYLEATLQVYRQMKNKDK